MQTGVGISNVGILFICKNIVRNESHDTLAVFVLDDFENRLERSNNHILSEQLTAEFGKGFDKSNLRKMQQFYCTFPILDTLCPELSWSHYRVLMRINEEQALIDHLQHFLLGLGRGFSFVQILSLIQI